MRVVLETTVSDLKKAFIIPWEEIKLGAELGSGTFGTVHKALWRDLRVAVKVARGNQPQHRPRCPLTVVL